MRIFTILSINIIRISILVISIFVSCLTKADYLSESMRKANAGQWHEAISIAKRHNDSVLQKMILSRQFQDSSDKQSTFEQIISFVLMNPLWPNIEEISAKAEARLNPTVNKTVIVKWFESHRPRTPNGFKYYALSAKGNIHDPGILSRVIKEGWIYGHFSEEESKSFLAHNKNFITQEDHVRKMDVLLWDDKRTEARRVLSLVGGKANKYFEAFTALLDHRPNANSLFHALPDNYKYNTGILNYYLSQFKKSDQISIHDAELLLHTRKDHLHASQLWRLQNLVARNLLKFKHYNLAYKIVSSHQCNCNKDINESEFLSGWIAFKYLHDYKLAYSHFEKVNTVVKYSISIAKSAYWLGKSAMMLKDKELAHKWFREAAAYNFTFHGQLALLEMGKDALTLPQTPKITASDKAFYKKNEFVRAVNIWLKEGRIDKALVYARSAIAHAKNVGEVALIVNAIKDHNKRYYTTETAKAAAHYGYFIAQDHNPTPYKIKKGKVEPALTYAIILRESVFDQRAISNANAHGLMQVVPATGCTIAKKLKMHCNTKSLTHDALYNITLGNKYLETLLERYNGSYLLAIASYNAGPHVIDRWIEQMGDPRKFKDYHKVLEWIDSIPYYETREYVQRVLENLEIYRVVLGHSSHLMLKKDLMRGK